MVKSALYLTVVSWVLLLIGMAILGAISRVLGNPWLLVAVGIIIVAAWSVFVYDMARGLATKRVRRR
ncbi:MAG: hypothetical protein RXN91_01970 [Caldivirga sp.]|jgi:predicted DCC family thiol-disulfide oxidoreductase YuxK